MILNRVRCVCVLERKRETRICPETEYFVSKHFGLPIASFTLILTSALISTYHLVLTHIASNMSVAIPSSGAATPVDGGGDSGSGAPVAVPSSHPMQDFEYDTADPSYSGLVEAEMCLSCRRPAFHPVKHGGPNGRCLWRYCADCLLPSAANPCTGRLCSDRANTETRAVQDRMLVFHDMLPGRCRKCRISFTRRDFLGHQCTVIQCPQGCGAELTSEQAQRVKDYADLYRGDVLAADPSLLVGDAKKEFHYFHCPNTDARCLGTSCNVRCAAGKNGVAILQHVQSCPHAKRKIKLWQNLLARLNDLPEILSASSTSSASASATSTSDKPDAPVRTSTGSSSTDAATVDKKRSDKRSASATLCVKSDGEQDTKTAMKRFKKSDDSDTPSREQREILVSVPQQPSPVQISPNNGAQQSLNVTMLAATPFDAKMERDRVAGISGLFNQPPLGSPK